MEAAKFPVKYSLAINGFEEYNNHAAGKAAQKFDAWPNFLDIPAD
ncbi:MAG TPA: hypothetical protein VGC14_20825 [Rhizobium sp.]